MPVDLPFFKIQHIGIPVKDIQISIDFYTSLGFTNVMQSSFTLPEGDGTCVMMQKEEIIIEIYQLPESLLASDILMRKDGHIDHFAIDVKDIANVFETIKTAGYHLVQESPVYLPFWKNGCKFFHIVGPDGERIEFNEVL